LSGFPFIGRANPDNNLERSSVINFDLESPCMQINFEMQLPSLHALKQCVLARGTRPIDGTSPTVGWYLVLSHRLQLQKYFKAFLEVFYWFRILFSSVYSKDSCKVTANTYTVHLFCVITAMSRSQWPPCLRHESSSPAQILGYWIRIPLEAWISVCVYSVFVLPCVHVTAL
jgi:hypothetical protein